MPESTSSQPLPPHPPKIWLRAARYLGTRLLTIVAMVVVAVAITLYVANMGGYVDEIIRSEIMFSIAGMGQGGWLSDVPTAERNDIMDRTVAPAEEARASTSPSPCAAYAGWGAP